jgi:uncharacterized protein YeaO (DUF488 family)
MAALHYWCKDIAPSAELRTWFDHRPDRFAEFEQRYSTELMSNPAVSEILQHIGRHKATLLYGARDPTVNHASVLAKFLRDAQSRPLKRSR